MVRDNRGDPSTLAGEFPDDLGGGGGGSTILFRSDVTASQASVTTISTGITDQTAKEFHIGLASGQDVFGALGFERTESLSTSGSDLMRYLPQWNSSGPSTGEWDVELEHGVGTDIDVDLVVKDI